MNDTETSSPEIGRLILDACVPPRPAPDAPAGSRAGVDAVTVRTAELLAECVALPPVVTRASADGAARSTSVLQEAHREHAAPVAGAIPQRGGG